MTPICSARFVPHCPAARSGKTGPLATLSPVATRAGMHLCPSEKILTKVLAKRVRAKGLSEKLIPPQAGTV